MRPKLTLILCALLLAATAAPAAARPTAAGVAADVRALIDRSAAQWAGLTTPEGDFLNPFPADLARGHGSFAPPMLSYALERAGQRSGARAPVAAAERAWPRSVDPVRASAFDMVGAAYAYRQLTLSAARRTQLAGYMSRYGIPTNGFRCLIRPDCYSNLKLVDALAVLAITGAGIRSATPGSRLSDPVLARRGAARVVNRRIPAVIDHGVVIRVGRDRMRGTTLSDPPSDPLAYHALSTFMLSEAIGQLGPDARRPARRALRQTRDALVALVAPDGDTSYLGRGQGQVWVPALTAAALAEGARDLAGRQPRRARRYLAGARRAVQRLERLYAGTRGLQLVPGQTTRTTADGIDGYAHTVAYNGLALFGLTAALDALDAIPGARVGRLPAGHRMRARDDDGTGLGVVSNGHVWMAVHRTPTNRSDLRHDFGLLALKRRVPGGWVDLLAPRPLTLVTADSGGPALIRGGRPITPTGFGIHVRGSQVTVDAGYERRGRWVRRVHITWRLTPTGARMRLTGAHRHDRFRMMAWTLVGTGSGRPHGLDASGARWRFSRPVLARRLPGYHSGPVENLDGLEAIFSAPRSGRVGLRIGI